LDLPERDSMEFDVVVVGAGPAGLATAIRLAQLSPQTSICVLEKGAEPGAHIMSGAVIDPRALGELFPEWKSQGAPLSQKVTEDRFLFLGRTGGIPTPHLLLPECFDNSGNYIASLSNLTRWLGQQAEALGVSIFAGFAAAEILYGPEGAVIGVATGDMGIGRDGEPGPNFQRGAAIMARYTVFAEGSRGNLGRQLIARFGLDAGKAPQSYALGVKEVWQLEPGQHRPGLVTHTAGWPMSARTYGGGFLYHEAGGTLAAGFITGLDYANPYLSPFEEFQRFKTHKAIRDVFAGGKRIAYGARAITAGGLQALPELVFPGGALVGCEAGFLNASRIKGSHAAIKSGMLAAEALAEALGAGRSHDRLDAYPAAFRASWLYAELDRARNFKQWFKLGMLPATLMTGVEQWLLPRVGVRTPPWTFGAKRPDYAALEPAAKHKPIDYPRPDGVLTFDRLSSVYLSNTMHQEDQPAHLTLKDKAVPVAVNLAVYAGPEQRYCPAQVYEFVADPAGAPMLRINAANCVHCKTCDIKDPTQNIVWVPPEGGGGPSYSGM
jgi:electron-transferring-flavoprotein dehydrogenase